MQQAVTFLRGAQGVPKAAHLLADDLRRYIIANHLAVGAGLPSERELIEQSGFSRGTVREALRQLEAEGLITIQRGPAGGISVAHPDTDQVTRSFAVMLALSEATLRHLFEFRETLEPAAAALAAQRATEGQRAELLEEAARYPESQVAHNADFHLCLAAATNNEFYRVTLSALLEITVWHSLEDKLSDEELLAAVRAHRRIAQHIVDGDADGARASMLRHLQGFRDLMDRKGRLDEAIVLGH